MVAARGMSRGGLGAKWQRLLRESSVAEPAPGSVPEDQPFPTAAQLELLKAALLPAGQSASAWRSWKARGLDLETVDRNSVRMFSRLWSNRVAAEVGPEDLPLLKGVYRHVFASNAVMLSSVLDATRILGEAGIPALFMKGAAMIARTGNLGLRLIDDVDILIPEAADRQATALLRAAGYTDRHDFDVRHSWDCTTPSGSPLDVHRWAFKTAGEDLDLFARACEATLLETPVKITSPTDSLMIAIAHGFRLPSGAPLRWIADALLVVQLDGEAIEWHVLLERARRPGLTLSLVDGLGFLAREFGAPVPPEVLEELRRRPVHWRERAAHWAAVKDRRFGAGLARALLEQRAHRLHCGSSRRASLASDLGAVERELRAAVRAVLVAQIRRFNPRATGRFSDPPG
jgi:hypothetical protein